MPKTIDWAKWDSKLGTQTDLSLAAEIGCSITGVTSRRTKLRIDCYNQARSHQLAQTKPPTTPEEAAAAPKAREGRVPAEPSVAAPPQPAKSAGPCRLSLFLCLGSVSKEFKLTLPMNRVDIEEMFVKAQGFVRFTDMQGRRYGISAPTVDMWIFE